MIKEKEMETEKMISYFADLIVGSIGTTKLSVVHTLKIFKELLTDNNKLIINENEEMDFFESSNQPIESEKSLSEPCSVCNGKTIQNEIQRCNECKLVWHDKCYQGLDDRGVMKCQLCNKKVCELCPNVDGLLQSTENGRWVHARCILFQKDPTKISIDSTCVICYKTKHSGLEKLNGTCVKCNYQSCENWMHVTCVVIRSLDFYNKTAICNQHNISALEGDIEIKSGSKEFTKKPGAKLKIKGKDKVFKGFDKKVTTKFERRIVELSKMDIHKVQDILEKTEQHGFNRNDQDATRIGLHFLDEPPLTGLFTIDVNYTHTRKEFDKMDSDVKNRKKEQDRARMLFRPNYVHGTLNSVKLIGIVDTHKSNKFQNLVRKEELTEEYSKYIFVKVKDQTIAVRKWS